MLGNRQRQKWVISPSRVQYGISIHPACSGSSLNLIPAAIKVVEEIPGRPGISGASIFIPFFLEASPFSLAAFRLSLFPQVLTFSPHLPFPTPLCSPSYPGKPPSPPTQAHPPPSP